MAMPKIIPQEIKDTILRYKSNNPHLSFNRLAGIIVKEKAVKGIQSQDGLRKYVARVLKESETEKFENENSDEAFFCPESLYEEHPSYILPNSYSKILVVADIHIPFHSKKNIETTFQYAKKRNIDCIIIDGDLLDCYSVSRFNKDIPITIADELKVLHSFFDYIRKMFPRTKIIYKEGNHDERWKHYIDKHREQFGNIPEFSLEYLSHCGKYNIECVKDKRVIQAGKLYIIHGHEIFSGSGAVNVARNIRLKTNDNVLFGHFHRTQDDFTRTISDSLIGSWAIGSLCGLSPLYMPINNWNNGFAIVNLEDGGMFEVENKKIVNGEIK